MDTIYRQVAIDALYHVDEYNGRSVEVIRNLPSTERHGKWVDPEDPTCYKCSICGEYATQEYGLNEPIFWRYCPNCGSRMDLEDDEDE